ncbi:AT-hook-containing transcription factor isoform X1 [Xyrichtys novacula]|uniref:AT-hook-containing transcription factor isoform X1 n=2 Tax=Xyrichtys novacula TaxID=13765 RepID=A0AAV1GBH0_XYRNO|nr:AT-hook-containing transcription factor isoform X1 [Xyrichtys novacula]
MERQSNTTAGILFWTPAPARTSPPSSAISEDEREHEEEEQVEKGDDFVSQMDENGIIGLTEALEDVEVRESCDELDSEFIADLNPGPFTPEEEDFRDLRDQSNSEPWLKWLLPGSDKYLDMMEKEEDGKKTGKRGRKLREEHLGIINGLTESQMSKVENVQTSPEQSSSAHLPAMETLKVSNHHCPVSQPASSVTRPTFPHLLHFIAEEILAAPGIQAETLPDMSSSESIQDSPRSHTSLRSSPPCHEEKLRASPQPLALFSDGLSDTYSRGTNRPLNGTVKPDRHHKQPTSSPRTTRLPCPKASYSKTQCLSTDGADSSRQTKSLNRESRAKNKAAKVDETRKESLSYPTPDFSKVEPRVRFPKGGYTPPKSRRSFRRDSLSPESTFVFKSPAAEVSLNTMDGSVPPVSCEPTSSALISIVPQESRRKQQATPLIQQLQEDYNRLLIKYAEAENTIDRLRLEAKVNLYSDPPKPGLLMQSGLNKEASKVMTLDFPQAQRAEVNTAPLHQNERSRHQESSSACPSTRSPGPQIGEQLAQTLYSQTEKFLQQLQTVEDLLRRRILTPVQQMRCVSQLAEGFNSLGKGYLLARDEHKLLQQQGADLGHFDPERELEGLIFQCGQHLEELKEQVEQIQQEMPICEVPPSPCPHHTSSSVSSEEEDTETKPQSPPMSSLADPEEAANVVGTSASTDGETPNSSYLKSVDGKHKRVDQHPDTIVDEKEALNRSQRDGVHQSTTLGTDREERDGPADAKGNLKVQKSLPQRKPVYLDSPPVNKQHTSRSSSISCKVFSQPTSPSAPCPSGRRSVELGKSHSSSLSSLGEITASEKRNSKFQTQIHRVLSQDGIISPEMDSGFVGSESSHPTPAAAPSPLHQRAPESVSLLQGGNSGKPQTGPITAPSPTSSLLHTQTVVEPRGALQISPDIPRRSRQRQRRRRFSGSLQRWSAQDRAESGTSEFGLESDSTASEDRLNVHDTESINSLHSSSSSPAEHYRHGNSFRALNSSQVADRRAAVETLQAEVSRLKGRLESCLKNQKPMFSRRAHSSAQENYTASTPCDRSNERGSDSSRQRRDRWTADDVGESTMRRATKRPTSAHRQTSTQHDVCAESSTSEPPPLVSRSTQTSSAARRSHDAHTNTVHSRTQIKQHPRVSETADEPDSRGRKAPLCPQCLSRHQGQPENVGSREPAHSSRCHHCLHCGCSEQTKRPEPDCRRVSDSSKHMTSQTAQPAPGGVSGRHFTAAAPPAALHCMSVCPPPLLFYSLPLYVSPSNSSGQSSGVRGREERRVRLRHSLSTDRQLCTDSSLDRAIRAARNMKHTSAHMARSLAAGLHYQELLTQSCSY